ncbi:ATP synthase subunit I [Chromatiaceae bacterium AAb-1]|nr:ATP synthase subunit I [Chromatiaceae bacterium AAb-1]
MSGKLVKQARKSAYLLLLCQTIIAGFIALAFFLGTGTEAAKSAFKGGLIAVIPGFVFAFFAFRYSGADYAAQVSAAFMRGHSLKILLTVVLFGVVFQQEQLVTGPFLTGFIITLLAQWTAPFFFKH